jgi:hypothetical protein
MTENTTIDPLVAEGETQPSTGRQRATQTKSPMSKQSRDTLKWARWFHVYSSMIAFLLIFFFGITGITLNHPTWTFGSDIQMSTVEGQLPFSPTLADNTADYLTISEFARSELGVSGSVDSFETTNDTIGITYRNPGYGADLFVDAIDGTYQLNVEQQGWVAVLNDLHKGRDSGSTWSWVIDVSAAFLVVVSLTGLLMQFFLRRRRRSAFASVAVGSILTVVLTLWVLS